MFTPDPDLNFLPITDPGVKKAPDPGHWYSKLHAPWRYGQSSAGENVYELEIFFYPGHVQCGSYGGFHYIVREEYGSMLERKF